MPFKKAISVSSSELRLEKLLVDRRREGADKAAIDERIWNLFGEEWAVMFTDLSGFSRHVAEFGIIHFLQTIYESERILMPVIDDHDGILLKTEGDSMLVIFRRPDRAIACAIEMQRKCRQYNAKLPPSEQVLLCVGIGYGRMLRIGDSDVYGAQVNAASKLGEDKAKAYEILVTGEVKEKIGSSKRFRYRALDVSIPGATAAYVLEYNTRARPGKA
ncbi:MAG: adenylate/guanylate cyclase domain-containing protein [Dehalococcoidia bacterium]|nr:MAG: adenylate/guanylate cyclase domain-containing protein [Dehalococcoidia bacterium]